jgi:hypothetical protein
MKREN